MQPRHCAIQDGQEITVCGSGQEWRVSWHPPLRVPAGTPHGSAGICFTADQSIVLIGPDGDNWGLPGGRPEGKETWEETLRREVQEEACATVRKARLLGFSRSNCVSGSQEGLVLVRAFWQTQVELAKWLPQFEVPFRRIFPSSEVRDALVRSHLDGSAPILLRAFDEAMEHQT